jgi:hypothetical protein
MYGLGPIAGIGVTQFRLDHHRSYIRVDCRFASSVATTSFVFRVSVKVTIDRRIDHLQGHPMGRNPKTLVHTLGALHPRHRTRIHILVITPHTTY